MLFVPVHAWNTDLFACLCLPGKSSKLSTLLHAVAASVWLSIELLLFVIVSVKIRHSAAAQFCNSTVTLQHQQQLRDTGAFCLHLPAAAAVLFCFMLPLSLPLCSGY
jgi:uncharacterized membrane protein